MKLKCEIKEECSIEIQKALEGNSKALEDNIKNYSKRLKFGTDAFNERMKKYNDKMQTHLNDFENKKKNFFQFDTFRGLLFWVSQIVMIALFVKVFFFL